MTHITKVVQEPGVALRRGLAPVCLLILTLLLAHQALMISERHAEVMGSLRGHTVSRSAPSTPMGARVAGVADDRAVATEPAPHVPPVSLGECPAQQAVLPLLLLLLLLSGALRRFAIRPARGAVPYTRARGDRFLPPPLAPARRRALLQVFLN